MAKLTERYVQEKALNYLKDHYEHKCPNSKCFAHTEVVSNFRKNAGRADGLLAFRKSGSRIYTVSLEAKSHKTFRSLKSIAKDTELFFMFVGSIIACSIVSWLVFGIGSWWIRLLIAAVAGTFTGIAITVLLCAHELFDTNGIIEQVKCYPADEKWIALSIDMYNKYISSEGDALLRKARASGIGMLVVGNGNSISVKAEAQPPKLPRLRSHIYHYKTHKTIIRFLDQCD